MLYKRFKASKQYFQTLISFKKNKGKCLCALKNRENSQTSLKLSGT